MNGQRIDTLLRSASFGGRDLRAVSIEVLANVKMRLRVT